jgi:glycerol-3-phosphate dehydrogenase (NAD(P)+)
VAYLGGDQASVAGLPGTGDLYVTCQAGRNCRMGRLLGLGLTYSRAKADHMAADTVEGADLALALGPTLEAMMATGSLPNKRMPLTRAIIDAICRDQPLVPSWKSLCGTN